MSVFIENMSTLKAIKLCFFKVIKRILHSSCSWSIHMKFIKLAECSFEFYKMSYEMTTRVRSSIYESFVIVLQPRWGGGGGGRSRDVPPE